MTAPLSGWKDAPAATASILPVARPEVQGGTGGLHPAADKPIIAPPRAVAPILPITWTTNGLQASGRRGGTPEIRPAAAETRGHRTVGRAAKWPPVRGAEGTTAQEDRVRPIVRTEARAALRRVRETIVAPLSAVRAPILPIVRRSA